MSLGSQTQRHFAQSQRILAQMHGMSATARGNTLYKGANYTGVYGNPQVDEVPNAAGGRRRLTTTTLTLTRDQFVAPPQSETKLIRTDITPQITYSISSVDTHDPVHYVLTLIKVGA